MIDPRGTCLTDNQGNPLPQVGGQCDLGLMHLNASAIQIPDEEAIFGMGLASSQGLDWEFYGVNNPAVAGAQPASQNDFYGSLYSMAAFGVPQQQGYVQNVVSVPMPVPCNCNQNGNLDKNRKNNTPARNSFLGIGDDIGGLILFLGFFLVLYIGANN